MACGQCGHACSISQRCSALLPCSGLCYCASSCHRPQAAPLRCKAQPRVCAAWSYFLGWAVGPLSSVRKKRQQVLAGHLRGTTITRGPTTGELAQPPAEAQRGCTAHRRPASWQWAERRTGRTKSQAQSLTEAEAKPGLEVRHVVETQICPDGTYSGNPPPFAEYPCDRQPTKSPRILPASCTTCACGFIRERSSCHIVSGHVLQTARCHDVGDGCSLGFSKICSHLYIIGFTTAARLASTRQQMRDYSL